MTTGINVARIIGLLSLLVGLGGCSAIKLGYNNLPELAYWWADGYADFDDVQGQRVREDLARLHDWHRRTELPRAGELLQRVERLAAGEVTPGQVCELVPELRARLQAAGERAEPGIVTTGMSLSAAQLQRIERKFAQNNSDYRKEWVRLSPADLLDKRVKLFTERMEMVYGSLSDAQLAALRRELERSAFDPQRALVERQRRQQDILQTLRRLGSSGLALDDARRQVQQLLQRMVDSPDPAYRAAQQAQLQESCRVVATTHNSTTPAQREHAVRRLRAYQKDLRELAQAR